MIITERWLNTNEDYDVLSISLSKDEFHKTTKPEFFYAEGTASKIYEDEKGPIFVMRGSKSLRLDIQFIDNNNKKRNAIAMLHALKGTVEQAKANGFKELIFNTSNKALEQFCIKYMGFEKIDGQELRKFI